MSLDKIVLEERDLTMAEVIAVAREDAKVELSQGIREKLLTTRKLIEGSWSDEDAPLIYSFNTGVGAFKDRRISQSDIKQFQTNLIYAHATGIGEPLSVEAVRAVMLLRLNAFRSDHSGVSPAIADRLIAFLNKGLAPVIPAKGSVGASGDLAPLAHMAGAMCGYDEAEIIYDGKRLPAADALALVGLPREMDMQSKDASALINGSTVSLAVAVLATWDAEKLARHADLGLALSLEAMRCEKDAFHPALHAARPHPGQGAVARNMMKIIGASERMSAEARKPRYPEEGERDENIAPARVQDTYSLRCAPQVHGPAREALAYVRGIVEREINSATDNPLIVWDPEAPDGSGRRAISGGHFHGQYIAQAMDLLAMAMTDLGSICERRVARLIDPNMSYGLPRNLTAGKPGLNTGYSTVQCSISALVMENRTLCMPGSVDSIPGKGNAEDHVSNSMWCAQKARQVVDNLRAIVSVELLTGAQAISMVEAISADHPLAPATEAVVSRIREDIPARLEGDLWYAKDMQAIAGLVGSGAVMTACEAVTGALE